MPWTVHKGGLDTEKFCVKLIVAVIAIEHTAMVEGVQLLLEKTVCILN